MIRKSNPFVARSVALVMIVAAAGYFLVRGPYRAMHQGGDQRIMYAAARAFLNGGNPYDQSVLTHAWIDAGNSRATAPGTGGLPFLNPPCSLVFLVPLALFPWPISQALWIIIHVGGLAALLWQFVARSRMSPFRAAGLIAYTLAFAPLHTGIGLGQPSMTVFLLVGFTFLLTLAGRDVSAGLLLGAATCLKPHLTLIPLAFYLLIGRRKVFYIAMSLALMCVAVTSLWLGIHHIPWISAMHQDLLLASAPGQINDPSPRNVASNTILNLAVIALRFTTNTLVASAGSAIVAAVLLLFAAAMYSGSGSDANQLLFFATIMSISLLPLYHRNYDAVFLFFALAWAFGPGWVSNRGCAVAVMILLSVFIVPGAKLLIIAQQHLPASVIHTFTWQMIYVHEAWVTLLCCIALLWALRAVRRSADTHMAGAHG